MSILGDKPEALGRSFRDVWAEAWDEIGPIAERALGGTSTYIENFPLVINRSGTEETAWFTFCYSPLRRADGSVAGMLDTVVETTSTVRAQADLALINQELGHRLKNTLAMVQSIASQTLGDECGSDPHKAFSERIIALGQAHDILLRRGGSSASLREVIAASTEPHGGAGQIQMLGPEFAIGSRAAVMLSLMLNELATNAVKYGALATPAGRIALAWQIEDDQFGMSWHERGGPDVVEPVRIGFGSKLIRMGLGSGSKVVRRYPRHGFELEITAPLHDLTS